MHENNEFEKGMIIRFKKANGLFQLAQIRSKFFRGNLLFLTVSFYDENLRSLNWKTILASDAEFVNNPLIRDEIKKSCVLLKKEILCCIVLSFLVVVFLWSNYEIISVESNFF
jgi:hypothetical protein